MTARSRSARCACAAPPNGPDARDARHPAGGSRSPAESGIAFRVHVVEPLGPHMLLTGEAEGQSLRVLVPPDMAVRAGEIMHAAARRIASRLDGPGYRPGAGERMSA